MLIVGTRIKTYSIFHQYFLFHQVNIKLILVDFAGYFIKYFSLIWVQVDLYLCYKTLFGGNLDLPKITKFNKNFVMMSEPAQKCGNNDIFKTLYLSIALEMVFHRSFA